MIRQLTPTTWQAFHLPRGGHTADEYEDAFAARADGRRFAIADGASESSFAGQWSRLLVESFTSAAPHPRTAAAWLRPLRQQWLKTVDNLSLPWYAEAKRAQGAFATFLGLIFAPSRSGTILGEGDSQSPASASTGHWRAVAVGDCCLFQVRRDALRTVFPIARSNDFNNRPELISSLQGARLDLKRRQGSWRPGDQFLLMTDALAHWFVLEVERGNRPWQAAESIRNATTAFPGWIGELRKSAQLRNDDVTLVTIGV
jgi:hypothetical protein